MLCFRFITGGFIKGKTTTDLLLFFIYSFIYDTSALIQNCLTKNLDASFTQLFLALLLFKAVK